MGWAFVPGRAVPTVGRATALYARSPPFLSTVIDLTVFWALYAGLSPALAAGIWVFSQRSRSAKASARAAGTSLSTS